MYEKCPVCGSMLAGCIEAEIYSKDKLIEKLKPIICIGCGYTSLVLKDCEVSDDV